MATPIAAAIGKAIEGVEAVSNTEAMNEIVADAEKMTEGLWPEIQKQEENQSLSPVDIGRETWKTANTKELKAFPDAPRYVYTLNQSLENDRHPITGVYFEKRVVELPDGEKIEGVFPCFEAVFVAKIPERLYLQSDKVQFRECNKQLAQEIDNNPALKGLFSEEQLEQIRDGIYDGTAPDGYVWHHDVEAGKLQLVDFEVHSHTGHTGGRYVWGGGSDKR